MNWRRICIAPQIPDGCQSLQRSVNHGHTVPIHPRLGPTIACCGRLAGADGFTALLRRALALAGVELPSLHGITEKADGSMEGLEELAADSRIDGIDAAVAITTHLLGLLVTLVGEPLTMRLVREAWPDASWDESH
jgi:hypothetical protein